MLRAKFRVESVVNRHYTTKDQEEPVKYGETVLAYPVYSPDKTSENYAFAKATPNGQIMLFIENPAAFGKFVAGHEYYVDFTPA